MFSFFKIKFGCPKNRVGLTSSARPSTLDRHRARNLSRLGNASTVNTIYGISMSNCLYFNMQSNSQGKVKVNTVLVSYYVNVLLNTIYISSKVFDLYCCCWKEKYSENLLHSFVLSLFFSNFRLNSNHFKQLIGNHLLKLILESF